MYLSVIILIFVACYKVIIVVKPNLLKTHYQTTLEYYNTLNTLNTQTSLYNNTQNTIYDLFLHIIISIKIEFHIMSYKNFYLASNTVHHHFQVFYIQP